MRHTGLCGGGRLEALDAGVPCPVAATSQPHPLSHTNTQENTEGEGESTAKTIQTKHYHHRLTGIFKNQFR